MREGGWNFEALASHITHHHVIQCDVKNIKVNDNNIFYITCFGSCSGSMVIDAPSECYVTLQEALANVKYGVLTFGSFSL